MTVFGNAMTVGLRNHVMVNGDDRAPQPCDEVCGDGRAPLPVHGMAYDGAPLPDGDCPDGRASQLQPGECGGAQAGALYVVNFQATVFKMMWSPKPRIFGKPGKNLL